jgi:DNA repair exonuclease SbcCD nuclease subunit
MIAELPPDSQAGISKYRQAMGLTFLHTADWQLGKPFASVGNDAKRFRLQEQRIQTIRELTTKIEESGAAFVIVAGDLFDSPHVTKATVSAACGAIGSLKIPVIAIPGNHDHGGPGSIWEQEFFLREQHQLAPNFQVLLKPEPLVLDSAVIFPAPLLRRHEPGDPTAWIRQAALDPSLPSDRPRLVLAHGTIQGFGSQQNDEEDTPAAVNWIDLSSLPLDAIDYIALGDWHGTKQVGPKAWYSGTPEIDRFPKGEGNDPGNVLKVTLSRAQSPVVERVTTGRFAWKELAFRFSDDAILDLFPSRLDELIGQRGDEHLLLLTLEGSLGMEASGRLEKIIESLEARLVRLKLDTRVTIAPTDDEIAALTRRAEDPLIATVATELVSRCQGDSEEAVISRIALRELHTAIA